MNRIFIVLFGLLASLAVALPAAAADRDRYRDFDGYHGYRQHPYDRGRHYGQYKHRKYEYDYRGHWRSWNDFDRYIEKHPEVRRYGRYYQDGAHLMFRSCAPGANTCIFFSIGR